MDEDGMALAAEDIADCPDFELDTDGISEVVATEVALLDPEMYVKVHAKFELPDKLGVRVYLAENLLDDKEEIKERLDEVVEALEYLSKGTIGISDMRIQVDFAFESENNSIVPDALPEGFGVQNQLANKDPTDDRREEEEGEEEEFEEDAEEGYDDGYGDRGEDFDGA
jgi:phosphosulfolactate synthase (CoM biosynthesis protein A)